MVRVEIIRCERWIRCVLLILPNDFIVACPVPRERCGCKTNENAVLVTLLYVHRLVDGLVDRLCRDGLHCSELPIRSTKQPHRSELESTLGVLLKRASILCASCSSIPTRGLS